MNQHELHSHITKTRRKTPVSLLVALAGLFIWLAWRTLAISTTVTARQIIPQTSNGWSSHGPRSEAVTALAIDPSNPNILYVGTVGGEVFKSIDDGASWQEANTGRRWRIKMLKIDPSLPDTLSAAGTGPGLFKSTNGGASWGPAGLIGDAIVDLTIDPNNSATLYAAVTYDEAWGSNVFLSSDGGRYWDPLLYIPLYLSTSALINPANSNIIYAGGQSAGGQPAVYKSVDAGAHWALASPDLPIDGKVASLVMDRGSPDTIYALIVSTDVNYSAVESVNGAVTWSRPRLDASALAIEPGRQNILYAGTHNRGVFRSTDGGVSWDEFNTGLTALQIYALAIDSSGTTLHAGTQGGVFDYHL